MTDNADTGTSSGDALIIAAVQEWHRVLFHDDGEQSRIFDAGDKARMQALESAIFRTPAQGIVAAAGQAIMLSHMLDQGFSGASPEQQSDLEAMGVAAHSLELFLTELAGDKLPLEFRAGGASEVLNRAFFDRPRRYQPPEVEKAA